MAKITLTTYVASSLQGSIINGEYPPGERLPNEDELATQFGVSRTVIRDATKLLIGQNVLYAARGKGIYVKADRVSNDGVAVLDQSTIKNLYETRRLLETGVIKVALMQAQTADLKKLRTCLEKARSCVEQNRGPLELIQYDDEFHQALALCTHNDILIRLLGDLRNLLVMARIHTLRIPGRPEQSVSEHERIFSSLEKKDSDGAVAALYLHLTSAENALLEYANEAGSQGSVSKLLKLNLVPAPEKSVP